MNHLEASNLSFAYNGRSVLQDISLSAPEGALLALLGPNGSGKSTLLKILAGLLPLQSGEVRWQGRSIADIGRKDLARLIAYVPQVHSGIFPYRVIDVVLMGRLPHKSFFFSFNKADKTAAYDALERLSISHLAERPYTDISQGELQLTLIARALTQGAGSIIMDEPASGLDYGNQTRLLRQIGELRKDGFSFIMATHFPEHALQTSDITAMLKHGRIMAEGHPALVITEANLAELYDIFDEKAQSQSNRRMKEMGAVS